MVDITYLRQIFYEKLKDTNNLDDAFIKAVWVAYQLGFKDGEK